MNRLCVLAVALLFGTIFHTAVISADNISIFTDNLTESYLFPHSDERYKSAGSDGEGHRLRSLWTRYRKYAAYDLPDRQIQCLDEIIRESVRQNLPKDFYDASTAYVSLSRRIDWKNAAEAADYVVSSGLGVFGPMVDYLLLTDFGGGVSETEYLLLHRQELLEGKHSDFYLKPAGGRYGKLPEFVWLNISDDYEFLLWYSYISENPYLIGSCSEDGNSETILNLLAEHLGASYPNGTFVQLRKSCDRGSYGDLRRFEKEYNSRALSLYATYELLDMRKDSLFRLQSNRMTGNYKQQVSSQLRVLLGDIDDAVRKRNSFRGEEKRIASYCPVFENISSEILAPAVRCYAKGPEIGLITKNLSEVDVKVMRDSLLGQVVFKEHLENIQKSCYYNDTLRFSLPDTDDGTYIVNVSRGESVRNFPLSLQRLSVAGIRSGKEDLFYLCNAFTGEPIGRADVAVLSGKDTLSITKNHLFSGWTSLDLHWNGLDNTNERDTDEAYRTNADKYRRRVIFQVRDDKGYRMEGSIDTYLYGDYGCKEVDASGKRYGRIFSDRAAYNPGDTVCFKVISWSDDGCGNMAVSPEGTYLKVELQDSRSKILSSAGLKLNDFGSAAGLFVIPQDVRNGTFSLMLSAPESSFSSLSDPDFSDPDSSSSDSFLSSLSITVDDFVTDDFFISFSEERRLSFVGDRFTVSGCVRTYTGHPLSGAKAGCVVRLGEDVSEKSLELNPDGTFSIDVDTGKYSDKDYLSCMVQVRVTDGAGRSLERSTYRFLSNTFPLDVVCLEENEGTFSVKSQGDDYRRNILTGKDTLRFSVGSSLLAYDEQEISAFYRITRSGEVADSGLVSIGDTVPLVLEGLEPGLYNVDFEAVTYDDRDRKKSASAKFSIYRAGDNDTSVCPGVERYFRKMDSDSISIRFGISEGPVWAICYIDDGVSLLDSKIVSVSDNRGVGTAAFAWDAGWPDTVNLTVLYFKGGESFSFNESFSRTVFEKDRMPLELYVLRDYVVPGQVCSLAVKGLPESECVVSVFDKKTEVIRSNIWSSVSSYYRRPYIYLQVATPRIYGGHIYSDLFLESELAENVAVRGIAKTDAAAGFPLKKELADFGVMERKAFDDLAMRESFVRTLCFEPFVRTDSTGMAEVQFVAGDELSTFVVSVFAHNRSMDNDTARKDFVVSLPVEVDVSLPRFLYSDDRYDMSVTLSNSSGVQVDGKLVCEVYLSDDYRASEPVSIFTKAVTVGANQTETVLFPMLVSEFGSIGSVDSTGIGNGILGFRIVFVSGSCSDGIFVKVPVRRTEQTLKESHSIVQPAGMSDEEAFELLSAAFSATSPFGASFETKSAREIVSDFYIDIRDSDMFDAVSASAQLFNILYHKILGTTDFPICNKENISEWETVKIHSNDSSAYENLLMYAVNSMIRCSNTDGGFGWLPGMHSNASLTEFILYRMWLIADAGLWERYLAESELGNVMDKAVGFLDRYYGSCPLYDCTSEKYLWLRSLLRESSPWTGKRLPVLKTDRKIRKNILDMLTDSSPSAVGILPLMSKVSIILDLLDDGHSFALSLGFSPRDCRKLEDALAFKLASMVSYACETSYGGYYYPNAIMPLRGLLASEAFVHSEALRIYNAALDYYRAEVKSGKVISPFSLTAFSQGDEVEFSIDDVMRIRDGLYLWLIVQKESQYWYADPAFCQAVAAIVTAPESVLDTRIATLSKTYTKPLSAVGQASGGMSVFVDYYRIEGYGSVRTSRFDMKSDERFSVGGNVGNLVKLKPGECLEVGDKIIALYRLETETSRSFVKMTAARPAALGPLDQLSGWDFQSGDNFFRSHNRMNVRTCYREVKSDRTVYWFDTLPEGQTLLFEELVVTQAGNFFGAASELVCEYVSDYRANTDAPAPLHIVTTLSHQ